MSRHPIEDLDKVSRAMRQALDTQRENTAAAVEETRRRLAEQTQNGGERR